MLPTYKRSNWGALWLGKLLVFPKRGMTLAQYELAVSITNVCSLKQLDLFYDN